MHRGAWWATVRGVTKSQTRLSTHTRHLFRKDEYKVNPVRALQTNQGIKVKKVELSGDTQSGFLNITWEKERQFEV